MMSQWTISSNRSTWPSESDTGYMNLSAIQFVGSVPASQIQQWIWLGLRNGFAMELDDRRPPDRLGLMHGSADDAQDIRRSLAGDGQAYRRIVERYQNEIANRLRRFARDPRILQELVQDTFVDAYFSLSRFRGDAPLIHWLHRIAVRKGYRYWKAKKSSAAVLDVAEVHIAAEQKQPGDHVDSEAIELALARLSARDRLVVTLMYLEDRSVEETATLTGWSRTMVKVQAFRARGKLKKIMQERAT